MKNRERKLPLVDPHLLRTRDRLAVEPLALADAAQEACLSPFHFHRRFVQTFGQTPHAFATERRLERAKGLLLATDLSVAEVCLAVGYESPGSFSTRFLREFGHTPGAFREGSRRYWNLRGIRSHRFVPSCFIRMQNGKIREASARPTVLG